MSVTQNSAPDNLSEQGDTACGSRIKISPDTPSAAFDGEVVYFCGENCKQLFEIDPINSCLANRMLSNQR